MFNWFKRHDEIKQLRQQLEQLRAEQRALGPPQMPWIQGDVSLAKVPVNEQTALNIAAVFCAIDVKSNDFAGLPCKLYERLPDGGKREATEHPVYRLLHSEPNEATNLFVYRKVLIVHDHTRGNGYSLIVRDGGGRPVSIENLDPSRVEVKMRTDGSYAYVVDGDDRRPVEPGDMMHLRYFSRDGITGESPITFGRESLGAALAADRLSAAWFGNQGRPSGVLAYDQPLTGEASNAIRGEWNKTHGGENAGSTAVLGFGAKYTPVSMSAEDLQFLGLRQYSVEEICRWFNIVPHKLKSLGRATWGNISAESINYVRDCIRPLTIQFEAEAKKLLSPAERDRYFVEHNFKSLLEADDLTRHQVYQIGLTNRFYTVNEVRAWENLPPVEGGDDIQPPAPAPAGPGAAGPGQEPTAQDQQDPNQEGDPNAGD